MMAIDMIQQHHREIEELMRQVGIEEDDEQRAALRVELADMLAAHTVIEEELFYPAALRCLGPSARVLESLEEHAMVDFALHRFVSVSVADDTFSAKLATLKDVVLNHIEEEESELLPQVQSELDRQELDRLGAKMLKRFEQLLREGHRPILERSLGIVTRKVAAASGTKKAAPGKRPAKRKASAKKAAARAPGAPAAKQSSKRASPRRTKKS
jgi:hemerythrin superfamily protein